MDGVQGGLHCGDRPSRQVCRGFHLPDHGATPACMPAMRGLHPLTCLPVRQVFDVIGAAMKIPKDDMMGNATAMAKFAADSPGKTVQELCEADIAEVGGGDPQKAIKKEGPTVKLLWLSRAMQFIQVRELARLGSVCRTPGAARARRGL